MLARRPMVPPRCACLRLIAALIASLSGAAPSHAQTPDAGAGRCPIAFTAATPGPLGLVLSGGGARGFAHIGVLRVLDSLGVQADIVVGTSMGALVGALYAGGLSGREIDSLARGLPFESLFRRYEPISFVTAGDLTTPVIVLPPTFVLEFQGKRLRLQSPVAREPRINALFNQLLLAANLAAAGDFDRLPRRFRALATDTRTRSAVVLGEGDLAEAVRASIAIPLVFAPVERDGRVLVDGGLSDNVPVDVARNMGASQVFVSDVGVAVADSADRLETATMIGYLIDELFLQSPDSLGDADMAVRPPVREFSPLDFTSEAVGPLIDAGYRAAAIALRGCPVMRTPAPPPPSARPSVQGGAIYRSLARFADEGVFETVWLNPSRAPALAARADTLAVPGAGTLRLAPVAVLAPERTLSVGVSYDAHEGVRAWLAAANVAPNAGRLRLASILSAGDWRQQVVLTATRLRRHRADAPNDTTRAGTGRLRLPDPRTDAPPWSTIARDLLRPELSLTGTRDVVRIYDDDGHEQHQPTTLDLVAFAGLGATPVAGRRVVLGPIAHAWESRNTVEGIVDGRAFGGMLRGVQSFGVTAEGPEANTLSAIIVEALWLDRYRRASAHADIPLDIGGLIVRPRVGAGYGENLPLGAQLVLGGAAGFPGLRIGERRGERFAFATLAVAQRLAGPVYLRAEAGAGTTAFAPGEGTALIPRAAAGPVQGGEIGLSIDTPLGPFLLGYGISSTARGIARVRLGR